MQLTPKQLRFTDEYLVDLNGAQAAVRAGYSATGARQEGARLLAKADIRELVEQKRQETAAKLQIQREDVLRGLVAALELAKTQGQPMAMIAACRELGKMLGYYDRPAEEKGQGGGRKYEEMSDAELLALVQGGDGIG